MPSTYTDSLRLEEQGIGENNNTWGTKLNTTIDLIDKSIAGHVAVAVTSGTTTLTSVNNGEDQARYKIIEVTGTLSGNVVIQVPAVSKEYIVWDSTTRGGFTVSFRIGAAGSTILVPASTTRAFGISTDGSGWRPLSADLASETSPGIVEIASTAEAQAGSSNSVVLTPLRLQDVTATETRKGVIELATTAETQTGTDAVRAVTPAGLAATTATETRKGVIELATGTEVDAGVDAGRALTPATYTSNLNTRLGTTGTLGGAALVDTGTAAGAVPLNSDLGTASLQDYTSQDVTIDTGDFYGSAFTLRCARVGRLITLSADLALHSSNALPSSATEEIPATFRPLTTTSNVYHIADEVVSMVTVTSAGAISFGYRLWDGSLVARVSTQTSFSVSYNV